MNNFVSPNYFTSTVNVNVHTNSGVTSLKAYSMEGLPPAEETVTSSGSWAGEMLTGLDGCNNLLGAVKLAANRRYPLAFTPESLWYSVMEGASLHMESEISRAGITLGRDCYWENVAIKVAIIQSCKNHLRLELLKVGNIQSWNNAKLEAY